MPKNALLHDDLQQTVYICKSALMAFGLCERSDAPPSPPDGNAFVEGSRDDLQP